MPVFEIQGPDGKTYEIDAPDQSQALNAFKSFSAPAPQSPEMTAGLSELSALTQRPDMGAANRAAYDALPGWQKPLVAASDTLGLMADGVTFGALDKAAAAVRAPFTDKTYAQELDAQRAMTQAMRDRAGLAGTVAQIGGAVATPVALAGKGLTLAGRGGTAAMEGAKGLAARSGLMATEGALYGTADALGRDYSVTEGATVGALGGAAGNVAGEGLSKLGSKALGLLNQKVKTPDAEQLKKLASQAYQRADKAGVVVKPSGMQKVYQQVQQDLADFGYHPQLHPRIGAVLGEMDRLTTTNSTFKGLDQMRKIASSAGNSLDGSEKALSAKIIGRIDDFMNNLDPADVVMGDSKEAADAIKSARKYWSQASKLQMVDDLVGKAERRAGSTGSGGNVDNATRQNLRRILDDPKKGRGFTTDEKALLNDVVMGTTGQNALRLAGKLSPSGNGLMAALGVGGTMVNPLVGVASLGGMGAKALADKATEKNVEQLMKVIASGGTKSAAQGSKNALQLLAEAKRDTLGQGLSRALLGSMLVAPKY